MLRAASLAGLVTLALALSPSPGTAPARAASPNQALGIPCLPGPGGTRLCTGTVLNRVPSWDGVPLDVDVTLPPASRPGPYPLIVGLHGFGTNKLVAFDNPPLDYIEFAKKGYATLAYSARGIGFSCGLPVVGRIGRGCDKGWLHLADARYEVRDTQYLAGLLVDEGLVKPQKIGATGASYGGGQSLMLATLRDKVMLPDGRLVPWTSPKGTPMRIAAAAPKIGWSNLAYALVPDGSTLDYRVENPYGEGVGIVKKSYLDLLYAAGLPGYYAPRGADPDSDVTTFKAALDAGEPYDPAIIERVRHQFLDFRSPYYVLDRISQAEGTARTAPAPLVIYNGFNDDIMPVDEALRYANLAHGRFPVARVGMVFSAEFAHNRGSLLAIPTLMNRARDALFTRYLMDDPSAKPLEGVITATQGCDGAPGLGPFETPSWRTQHPGEVRLHGGPAQTFDSKGGDAGTATLTDPFLGGRCPAVAAKADPGAATYLLPPASERGYTLIGSPTVQARIRVSGTFPHIASRLWDVAPNGRQTLVTRGLYRPKPSGVQVFQLHPSGYRFAPGHRPKLELLGRDAPYAQPSKGSFEVEVSDLTFDLPVHEQPDGREVFPYDPPELCAPLADGRLRGRRLGPAALGRTRASNRRAFPDFRPASARVDRFCVDGGYIRVGYPSRKLGRRARRIARGRAVVLAGSSARLSVAGVRPGATTRAVRRPIRAARRLRVGGETWYVRRRRGQPALLFRVAGGRVLEVGAANRRLVRTRATTRRLLAGFR